MEIPFSMNGLWFLHLTIILPRANQILYRVLQLLFILDRSRNTSVDLTQFLKLLLQSNNRVLITTPRLNPLNSPLPLFKFLPIFNILLEVE